MSVAKPVVMSVIILLSVLGLCAADTGGKQLLVEPSVKGPYRDQKGPLRAQTFAKSKSRLGSCRAFEKLALLLLAHSRCFAPLRNSNFACERFRSRPANMMVASAKNTESDWQNSEIIDEKAMLDASKFKISPEKLVAITEELLLKGPIGVSDPEILADDFEFSAPVVGPLTKEEYLGTLKTFDLLSSFPDANSRFYNIHVDPFEPNRVWWFTRTLATHTGPLMGKPPTNKKLEFPPQANSFIFNEDGKIRQVTIGYVMDRRVGNTGGLGGAFGFFYGTGNPLPFPESRPYQRSWQLSLLDKLSDLRKMLPKSNEGD